MPYSHGLSNIPYSEPNQLIDTNSYFFKVHPNIGLPSTDLFHIHNRFIDLVIKRRYSSGTCWRSIEPFFPLSTSPKLACRPDPYLS